MRRSLVIALTITFFATVAEGDIITTFEDQGLVAGGYDNNPGPASYFTSAGNSFNNVYNTQYDIFTGWAMSATTDTSTPGPPNQYSAITGSGAGGSTSYGVAFTSAYPTEDLFHPADSWINLASNTSPLSIDVTNTTYVYLAMLDGYAQARKFVDGDYLRLDIRGYTGFDKTGALVNTVSFDLANFLGEAHYIISTWETLNLTSLAGAKSLRFGLRSTDNDDTYGMNTPAYVAVDNLRMLAVPEPGTFALIVSWAVSMVMLYRGQRNRCSPQGTVPRHRQ